MLTKIIRYWKCQRCGHQWWDKGELPKMCAKCKSLLYRVKPKRRPVK